MRKLFTFLIIISLLIVPVFASELTAPTVPDSAKAFMPSDPNTLEEGIIEILRQALMIIRPDLKEAYAVCLAISAAVMILCVIQPFPGMAQRVSDFVGAVIVATILLESVNSMIHLGSHTVNEISEYGKLLLPVITAAVAAQGGITVSAALYSATALFDAVLSSIISKLLIPMVYFFLVLAVACAAMEEETIKKLRNILKSSVTWILKTLLYIFTGYISITGVISGTTDAAALKAAKLTISGVVPVVGGILSDASEAVLIGAGTIKNTVGLYGMYAVIAIWIGPFVKIGTHYLLLKLTGGICSIFGSKRITDMIQDFSTAMGLLLAMTGTVCLMLMISMICFMKGVG